MSSQKPVWLSLLQHNPHVKKKRLKKKLSVNWSSSTISSTLPLRHNHAFENHATPVYLKSRQTVLNKKSPFFSNSAANEIQILSDSENESEHFMRINPFEENKQLELCVQSDSENSPSHTYSGGECFNTENRFVCSNSNHGKLFDNPSSVFFSEQNFVVSSASSSDEQASHGTLSESTIGQKFHPPFISKLVDCAIQKLQLPKNKYIRGNFSSRLAVLLRRRQSNQVIWMHEHNISEQPVRKKAHNMEHTQIEGIIKHIFLPTSTNGQIIIVSELQYVDETLQSVIIMLSTVTLNNAQLCLLQKHSNGCALIVTLTKPWSEIRLPNQQLIILAPFFVSFSEGNTFISTNLRHLSISCDCISTRSACDSTYSCKPSHISEICSTQRQNKLLPSTLSRSVFLVLQKSIFWFQNKLRYAFILNFTGGFLVLLFFPMSSFHNPLQHANKPQLVPGYVYDVTDLPTLHTGIDKELSARMQLLVKTLKTHICFCLKKVNLSDFESNLTNSIHTPSCLRSKFPKFTSQIPYIIPKTAYLQLNVRACLFTEQLINLNIPTSLCDRCKLNGMLLHEFPSGSLIAETILSNARRFCKISDFTNSWSTVFLICCLQSSEVMTESSNSCQTIRYAICAREAVTPTFLLQSYLSTDPQTCTTRVTLFGVVVTKNIIFLDAFSRIEVADVRPSPPCQGNRISLINQIDSDFFLSSGTIINVHSKCSQVWPLCATCFSDELKPLVIENRKSINAFECLHCLAKIYKPRLAVEIVVDIRLRTIVDNKSQLVVRLSMAPSRVAQLLSITEFQLQPVSLLNPNKLIGCEVDCFAAVKIEKSLQVKQRNQDLLTAVEVDTSFYYSLCV